MIASPVTVSVEPSNVRFDSAFALFVVPSDVSSLLSAGFDTVLNPVPLVPDEPDCPEEPEEPEEPA
jgi:hypothetical protein